MPYCRACRTDNKPVEEFTDDHGKVRQTCNPCRAALRKHEERKRYGYTHDTAITDALRNWPLAGQASNTKSKTDEEAGL